MKKQVFNSRGFGLIEVMIGFAILATGALIILNGIDFLNEKKTVADKSTAIENMVTGLVESIRSNIAMEKIDFNSADFLDNTSYETIKKSLKLCWVNDGILPLDVYPNCPGRIGYVITTLKTGPLELRGLYKVTIRLTHSELYPNSFKQYEFIVKDP